MGPGCACRGEAGVGRRGRGANGRGGHGSSCLHRIMFFCSGVFCKGFRRGMGPRAFTASCSFALLSFCKGLKRGKGLLVAPGECHGAEVRVLR